MAGLKCPGCGHENGPEVKTCGLCRKVLEADTSPPNDCRLKTVASGIAGRRITVTCAEKLAGSVEWLFRAVPREGNEVRDRALFWLGPYPFLLREDGTGQLEVREPDLRFADKRPRPGADVSHALAGFLLQVAIFRDLGIEPVEFEIHGEVMLIHHRAFEFERVYLWHECPREKLEDFWTDNGFFLGEEAQFLGKAVDDRKGNCAKLPVHELHYRRPGLVPALGLPKDFIALAERNAITEILDPSDKVVWRADPARKLFP